MYVRFFGLRDEPFKINPDPRYLFLTPKMEDAWDALRFGITTGKGLMVFTGEVGTGKTTLINRLCEWLQEQQIHAAFIFNARSETRDLFDLILSGFGVPLKVQTNGNSFLCLHRWLLDHCCADKPAVLIVDEAQGLSVGLLEQIRLLLDAETPQEKLLRIVLVGQPKLENMLDRPELRPLRQRIRIRCRTAPFSCKQTHAYIQSRLRIAGSKDFRIFTPEAIDCIHFYARGIPRVINLLCEQSLTRACADNLRPVPVGIVENAAEKFLCEDVRDRLFFSPAQTDLPFRSISMMARSATPTPAGDTPRAGRAASISKLKGASSAAPGANLTASHDALEMERAWEIIRNALSKDAEQFLDSIELTSEDAFRLLCLWALNSQVVTSAPPLHRVRSTANRRDPQDAKSNPVRHVDASAPHQPSAVTLLRTPHHSGQAQLWDLGHWLNRWKFLPEARWASIISMPRQVATQFASTHWLQSTLDSVELAGQRCSAWLREPAPVPFQRGSEIFIRWLQEPWS